MEGLRIAASVCSFVSLLLLIIALASDYWVVDSAGGYTGLWRACARSICLSYGMNVQDYFHATRAFLLMGMFAGAASFSGLCASFYRSRVQSISTTRLAVTATVIAGVCTLIAMSVFTGVYNDRYSDLAASFGWSFGLGWASFPLFLITSGLAFFIVPSTTEA
ncbi:protein NKG7-like [Eublepharis macularius]|uniref:Protein NKG7-like n=1 Tax=Eublepharis macularius TaxID=481883 RepID=A0AA97KHM2_EUBMA|nr:protein NKG7-like [Eublepharis macularius]